MNTTRAELRCWLWPTLHPKMMIHTIVAFEQECQISSMDNSNQDKAEFKGKKEGNPTPSQAIAGIQKGIILPQHFPRPLPVPRPICKIWLSFPEPPLPSGGIHVYILIRVLELHPHQRRVDNQAIPLLWHSTESTKCPATIILDVWVTEVMEMSNPNRPLCSSLNSLKPSSHQGLPHCILTDLPFFEMAGNDFFPQNYSVYK